MPFPAEYWTSYEHRVASLADFLDAALKISRFQTATSTRFAWRGITDADRPLYSSLVRRFVARHGHFPTEAELRSFESDVLAEARGWNLDWHPAGGRLSALELLAALQHYGVPTRMLDFTFNPLIALWFAVEEHDTVDGRVFAVDIADREMPLPKVASPEPWWQAESTATTDPWAIRPWVWSPPPLEPRMVRQEACFVMGGIPSTVPFRNVRRPGGGWQLLTADEVKACMSVPLTLITYQRAVAAASGRPTRGGPAAATTFTIRISNKAQVRGDLKHAFGYSHRSLFPDFPGIAAYGTSFR